MSEASTKQTDPVPASSTAPNVLESENASLVDSHKREQFAHAIAFGVPVPQALSQAGYTNVTVALGYQLLKTQEVVDIIEADRAWMREKMKLSQEQIVAQLSNDRAFAYACENAGAAVAATMAMAKVVGIADPHAGKGGPKRVIIEWGEETDDPLAIAKSETGEAA